ncbi:MAG: hypothetical protein Q4G22_08505 [Paracoccus sp. (in: a-proteobacteria)]|uniref:hypothetical protein n=1 Tax=Paracoccus sp. TaxID=267 RepID=UPI0026E07A9A|nr:hypothetical protein [Paracoccus sp. (in: a-proteobacteria)]MDO5631864.1 hypothetical protein [Paracoccus sp. (in: a-proteobacteria)]
MARTTRFYGTDRLGRVMALRCALFLTTVLLGAAIAAAPTVAIAQQDAPGRVALTLAFHGRAQEPGQSAADALAVSRAAMAAGFDVRRMEYPTALPDAPALAPQVALVFLSGDAEDGAVGGWPLDRIAARWQGAGSLILVAESCPATPGTASVASLPEPPPRALLAAPADCTATPRLTDALATALTTPGAEIAAALHQAGFALRQGAGWPGLTATPAQPATAGAGAADSLILAAPLQPVAAPSSPAPSLPVASLPAPAPVVLSAAALAQDRMARPTAPGLPEPSVIVGDPAPDMPDTASAVTVVEGQAIPTGFDERERLRLTDASLFASLLQAGAFDPAPAEQVSAIQAELARMGCYTGTVDGQWGAGSRAAAQRYFAQAGTAAPTLAPETALFRALAARPDLRCPAPTPQPVAQPAPRVTPAPAAPRPTAPAAATSAPRQPVARQPAPPPPAATPAPRRIDPNAIGSGVFR